MPKVTGEGSVVQLEKDKPRSKCRKWQLRVPIGRNPRTGKYSTRTRRVSDMTYTQAQKALRDFIAEIEGGKEAPVRTNATVEECASEFIARKAASGEFADGTIDSQQRSLKAVCRHIGRARVADVTPQMIDRMYQSMREGDTLSGNPVSGATLNLVHAHLSLFFKSLVLRGVVAENPCSQLKSPKSDTPERRALRPERMRRVIAQLRAEEEHGCAYLLAIAMGLRRGEICGLSWEDVDFDSAVLTVRHNYDEFRNLKQTKTRAGMRRLPIPSFMLDALACHKAVQYERIVARTPDVERWNGFMEQTGKTPVILNARSGRVDPDLLGTWWRRDRGRLGLDGWCLHELRHSYLSMLAEEGVHPKVMQELAGHASSRTTMDIYTHVNMDSKRAAAASMEDAFRRLEGAERGNDTNNPKPRRRLFTVRRRTRKGNRKSPQPPAHPAERFVPDSYQQGPLPAAASSDTPSDLPVSQPNTPQQSIVPVCVQIAAPCERWPPGKKAPNARLRAS